MNKNSSEEIENKLYDLGDSLKEKLPIKDLQNFKELVEAGENAIALEDLCTQITEHTVIIEKYIFEEIKSLCSALQIEKSYYEGLTRFNLIRE